ncbi:hypothetical protein M231_04571 [Tremella mesenterica]|uniref:Uncharacterized protein n=1 Tax=Tremella mesenterica TaxID=5217 RepID=A0A4V1M3V6_TREME|nr:hypothetical protein M231_04571 [Tremella mesenterica]
MIIVMLGPVIASTNNTLQALSIAASSLNLSLGDYIFQSQQTGKFLSYIVEGRGVKPDVIPTIWTLGTMEDDDDGEIKGKDWIVKSNKKRSFETGDGHCIAAQWGYDIGSDHAGVMYACPSTTGLRIAKLLWLFVPSTNTTCTLPSPADNTTCISVISIIACDHLVDQPARALSAIGEGTQMDYGTQPWGVLMDQWVEGNTDFLWELWRVS